jgi:hypothetical protein
VTFGLAFNQPLVQGVLTAGLTHVSFCDAFSQPLVEGVLPASLTHVTLVLGAVRF